MITFGQTLATLRVRRELSQSELARHAGVDASTISLMERNQRNASRAMVMDLAQALELDIDDTDLLREAAGYRARSTPEVDAFRRLSPDVQRAMLAMYEQIRRAA